MNFGTHTPIAFTGQEPAKAHRKDAAFDLVSTECRDILPGEFVTVKAGLKIALPDGHAALVLPRSGLAAKHGITVLNAPGLIDPEYTGEIGVVLINHGKTSFRVTEGMRVAQLMVIKTVEVRWDRTEELTDTARGDGFGSSGL